MIAPPPIKPPSSITPDWAPTIPDVLVLPRPQGQTKSPPSSFVRRCQQVGQHLYRILLLILLIIGLCTVFDEVIGDGPLPHLNNLKASAPALIRHTTRNTTAHFHAQSNIMAWRELKPSRTLLTALSPEIAAWLYDLHHNDKIIYRAPLYTNASHFGLPTDIPLVAAYHHLDGKLYLNQAFWDLNDGHKVAILAHEYRHFRQNPPKRFSRQLAQLISGGRLRYASTLEDEAFAYEKQAQAALGL